MADTKFLKDVPSEHVFRVSDGKVIRNLDELSLALETMSSQTYEHHVNSTKNDFRNWVYEIIGDHLLSQYLVTGMSIDRMRLVVNNRIKELELGIFEDVKQIPIVEKEPINISPVSQKKEDLWSNDLSEMPLTDSEIASLRSSVGNGSLPDKELRWNYSKWFMLGLLIGLLLGMLIARLALFRA